MTDAIFQNDFGTGNTADGSIPAITNSAVNVAHIKPFEHIVQWHITLKYNIFKSFSQLSNKIVKSYMFKFK